MDAKHQARPAVLERRREVRDPRPVRRPDLDEPRPGAPDDLRDPNAAADLDQLAARDGDAPTPPGEADGEGQRRRVVVRDERVLGAGQRDEMLLGEAEAGAAPARLAVELEQEVVGGRGCGGLDRDPRPRRAAQVRVDDDAGRVDHGLERHVAERGEQAGDFGGEVGRADAGSAPAVSRSRSAATTDRAAPASASWSTDPSSSRRAAAITASTLGGRRLVSVDMLLRCSHAGRRS